MEDHNIGTQSEGSLHAALKLPAAVREIRISPRQSPQLLLLSAASPVDFVETVLVSL